MTHEACAPLIATLPLEVSILALLLCLYRILVSLQWELTCVMLAIQTINELYVTARVLLSSQ